MAKRIENQIEEWLQSEATCDAANDFWGDRSFLHDDLPDFGEIATTWCRINGHALPTTHPIHPTVQ
ncbi:hypothetical protein G6L68_25305 [Agrobacterium fabrum]|uniref:hypothetical protein n=1 Tax=Agrobacterium fabrum TaxID=1176649 RepID=UPI000EF5CBFA|nr:hypothetical protein [Agrobacterium fabrum]AYM66206.1 hypothetical protein At12D13_50540 [Agrobacterium fabrum]NTE63952.1 hypothetical protein [Agrobacterium fabrum]